ncbi:acyl-CoA dehydrogenase family protein [Brevundimonas sp.]|uniref:acyl-CoA dehydrogenase family protein n=1 Tax=Brevundimonas sp. TaxID=1871086 RepID=UPI003BAC185E
MEDGPRYQPSRDQLEVASSIGGALKDLLPISRVHLSPNETDETWAALDDLGIFGIAANEADGGCGLGVAEEVLIVMDLGRRLAAPSVLATIGAGHAHWPEGAPRSAQPRVAAAYSEAGRIVIVDDPNADLVLLRSEGPGLHALPTASRTIDETVWGVVLKEADVVGGPLAAFGPRQAMRLRLLDAAALAGLAEAALDMAVAYAGIREQFGRPIGSFQAIKHRCADMALASRSARDLVTFAAVAFQDDRSDAAMLIEGAVFVAGTAALDNSGANIQVHGGIGFSDEADPHLLLKRTRVLLALAGGLEAASERVAAARNDEDPVS